MTDFNDDDDNDDDDDRLLADTLFSFWNQVHTIKMLRYKERVGAD